MINYWGQELKRCKITLRVEDKKNLQSSLSDDLNIKIEPLKCKWEIYVNICQESLSKIAFQMRQWGEGCCSRSLTSYVHTYIRIMMKGGIRQSEQGSKKFWKNTTKNGLHLHCNYIQLMPTYIAYRLLKTLWEMR